MRRASRLSAIVLFAFAPCSAPVLAQEAEGVVAETFVMATPITRPAPLYPRESLVGGAKEGWVLMSFVISPTGEVIEPMIEDSSGIEVFEREALRTVKRWRYEPATRNGVPVEQSMTRTFISFVVGLGGVTKSFLRKYSAIAALIEEGDFTSAQPLLEKLERVGGRNFYEDAWFWWLKYAYLEGTRSSDAEGKITALRRALGDQQDALGATKIVIASQRLFALEMQTGDLAAARRTYESLRDWRAAKLSEQYEPVMAQLKPTFDKIDEIVAGDAVLVSRAQIGTHDYWVHDLLRSSFSLGEVVGRVDVVDVRCRRGTKRYDSFPLDGVWRVPESWGKCGVYIKGEPGTTFDFKEYPSTTAAVTLSD